MNLSSGDLMLCLGVILTLSIFVFMRLNVTRAVLFAVSLLIYVGGGFYISSGGASAFRILLLALSCVYCLIFCQQFLTEDAKWWKGLVGFLPLLVILAAFYPMIDLNFLLFSLVLPVSLPIVFLVEPQISKRLRA